MVESMSERVQQLNQEHIRINAVLPRLEVAARERAAHAYQALAAVADRMTAAEARYDRDADPRALSEAVACFDELRTSPRWPHLPADRRSQYATTAARCLRERYELVADPQLLDRAIDVATQAVAAGEELVALAGVAADGQANLRSFLPPEASAEVADQMVGELVRL